VHLSGASAAYTDDVIELLNEKFVPFASAWGGAPEPWEKEARARFWKNANKDEKEIAAGQVREGSGWVIGSQFVVTTSAGRSLSGRVGRDGVAAMLKKILAAYAKLPKEQRQAKKVEGKGKPMPAPPAGGLVLTTYDRPVVREASGQHRLPKGRDINKDASRLAAPAGQRSTLWLTAEECRSLIPTAPRKGDAHRVPTKLTKRIALFGLWPQSLWVVEGGWLPDSLRKGKLELTVQEVTPRALRLRLAGEALLVGKNNHTREVKEGEVRYDARLEGVIVYDRAKKSITRWDMVALGDYTGEWFAEDGGRWREAGPDAPLRLGFSFELDRSDYDFPDRRRPRGFVHGYVFKGDSQRHDARERYYWDPEKWEADWKKK
jgi:hypothetical protein